MHWCAFSTGWVVGLCYIGSLQPGAPSIRLCLAESSCVDEGWTPLSVHVFPYKRRGECKHLHFVFFCVFQILAKFEGFFFCFFVFSPGFFFLDFFSIWKNSTFWPDFCLRITSKCGCTIKYFLEEGEIFLNQSPPAEKCQSWAFSSRDSHKFMQRITTNNHEPAQIWGFSKILIKNTDHR